MAISAPIKTSDFEGFLNPDLAEPIFEEAARQSVVMRLARRVPLGINGKAIPVVTSKPTANWVAEGGQKPATEGKMDLIPMQPHKLAAIAVMSAEVVRANPANYTSLLRTHLAEAFAIAFDYAALYGIGGDGTGTGPFSDALADTTKAVTLGTAAQADGGIHGDLVEVMSLLVNDGKKLTGWALDDVVEPLLWGAVDSTGRPLYVDLPTDDMAQGLARPGRLLNRPSFMGQGVAHDGTVAFGGDWTKAVWGAVGGISYRISTEATVTINGSLTSLWENNLVAVLAEAEYGFVVADVESFVAIEAPAENGNGNGGD